MDEAARALVRQAWRRQAVFTLCLAALIFASAGTLSYWQGWLFLFVFAGSGVTLGWYFLNHDMALLKRRMAAGPAAEREPMQKIIIALIMIGFLLLIVVPRLDYRWNGSQVPAWLVVAANAGIALCFVLFFIIMKQNRYAASTVTVEAGQPVISTGLYGIVRHPMYAGALLLLVCTPVALGSYWGLIIVSAASLPLLLWRLLDEERVLRRDLPGYTDYCRQVRYRLIPFLW